MMKRIVFWLIVCGNAWAELPPISGNGSNVSSNPSFNPNPAAARDYEMMKRLEQLQREVQQLTGKVEEQAYQLDELKKQQKTMYTDFDDRIQAIENKSGGSADATLPPPDSTSAPDPAAPTDTTTPGEDSLPSLDPSADPNPPSGPQTKLTEPVKPEIETKSSVKGSSAIPPPVAEPAVAASESEQQEYQQAYDDLRNGRTAEAISGFNAYIANHPGGGLASNSQYWLGEAHRVNQDNAAARKAFDDVVQNYPTSAKVPDALLKLGIIEMEEKNTSKAREYFTRITNEYASSKAARLAEKKMPMLGANAQ